MKTKEERKQEAREEYEKKIAPALKKYNKILKEFEEIRDFAWEEYEKKLKEIENEPK